MQMKFPLSAGALVRDEIIAQLRGMAIMLDLKMEVDEERGWLESFYILTVSGPEKNLSEFYGWGNEYFWALSKAQKAQRKSKAGLFTRLWRWLARHDSRGPLDIWDMPIFSSQGRDAPGRLVLD